MIRLLDPHTVNQIAAGEVVERPASVVKELVENAVDAGARRVEVTLVDYGRARIEVADDGHGIPAGALALALERHATSKIRLAADLQAVGTFGFRGEALPSIASVSRLTLSSGVDDGGRAVVVSEEGRLGPVGSEAGPRGTTVTVEGLFSNTPARLKFLKSDATELAACVEAVSRAAVSHPDVRFVLRHESAKGAVGTLLQTSGSGDLLTVLAEVWGREVARALVPLEPTGATLESGLRVRGYVSPPHVTRPTRALQWAFVNGRPVRSRLLQAALDQAFRSLTPERRFPVAALIVDVNPARVDVNVSPTKSEVRFQSEGAVFDAVRRAVTSALLAFGMVPSADGLAAANAALREARAENPLVGLFGGAGGPGGFGAPGSEAEGGSGASLGWAGPSSRTAFEAALAGQAPLGPFGGLAGGSAAAESGAEGASGGRSAAEEMLSGLWIHGQIDATFILAENDRAILIIDQHVAHERVLYERLRESRGGGSVEVQRLVVPETLHVGRVGATLLGERLAELRAIGYDLEPFGGESVIVRAVPALWRGRSPIAALADMVEELAQGLGQGCLTQLRDDVYTMCSCKMAVKAGDPLAPAEMERLVADLARTENPYLCPHGRPITIALPKGDLYRRFKRC